MASSDNLGSEHLQPAAGRHVPATHALTKWRNSSLDTDVAVEVWWRPGFPKPRDRSEGLAWLSRKKRAQVERDIWSFLEAAPKGGRREKPQQPDPQFEKRLEAAVFRLIEKSGGEEPLIRDVQEAAGVKNDDYGRRLERGGRSRDDIREWIKELAADHKRWLNEDVLAHYRRFGADRSPPQWEPKIRLRDLPRSNCD